MPRTKQKDKRHADSHAALITGLTRFLHDDLTTRAESGDAEAGLELLQWSITELDRSDSLILKWLKNKLRDIVDEGIEPSRALCVEKEKSTGGRDLPQ